MSEDTSVAQVGAQPSSSNRKAVLICFDSLYNEIREQFKTALPTLAGMLLYTFPYLISLRFVGDIGAAELAAAALAITLCNVTWLSLSVGLSSALTTLTSQFTGESQARIRATKVKFSRQKKKNGVYGEEESLLPNGDAGKSYNSNSKGTTQSTHTSHDHDDLGEPLLLLPLVFL